MKAIGISIAVVLVAAMMAAAIIVDGWALYLMWGWFAVPMFGLPTLSIWQAIGVSLTVGLVTQQYYATPDGKLWERLRFMFFHPLLIVLIGYSVKTWGMP